MVTFLPFMDLKMLLVSVIEAEAVEGYEEEARIEGLKVPRIKMMI